MGAEAAGFIPSVIEGDRMNDTAHVPELQLGESIAIAGVGTFAPKGARFSTARSALNLGGTAFCFDPGPTLIVYDYA